MKEIIIVYIIPLLLSIPVFFIGLRLMSKEMTRRRIKAENHLRELSQTPEGRKILEEESRERELKFGKIQRQLNILRHIPYILFFMVGIGEILLFFHLLQDNSLKEILSDAGNFQIFLAPVLIAITVIHTISTIKNRNKI